MNAIKDPVVTIERLYADLAWAQEMLADYESKGWTFAIKTQKRKIAAIKGTITRIARVYLGAGPEYHA